MPECVCKVQGDPGPRLLHVAGLLTSAATLSSSPAVGAMAAAVVQSLMFTSVCRGFISGQGHSADASPREGSGTTEVQLSLLPSSTANRLCFLLNMRQCSVCDACLF